MNKVLTVIALMIIGSVVFFISQDIKNVSSANAMNAKEAVIESNLNVLNDDVIIESSNDLVVTNKKSEIKSSLSNKRIVKCADISNCEDLVTQEMLEKFGLKDFVYSPTNDMNKARLFDSGKKESDFIKIGESEGRDVYGFEIEGWIGEMFFNKIVEKNNEIPLLNDKYLIIYDDEITIEFGASNEMQNDVLYHFDSVMYDTAFTTGESTHINKMPMCEGKFIKMELQGNEIVPIVPSCNGLMAKQADMIKINDVGLIKCIFPQFTMPDEVYVNPDQILYLECSGDQFSSFDSELHYNFKNLQAVTLIGPLRNYYFLNSLTSLKTLKLVSVDNFDIDEISDVIDLSSISIVSSDISNLERLSKFISLEKLSMIGLDVKSYDFLLFLDKLKVLNLDSQKLNTLPDFGGNSALTSLSVANNNLTYLNGVENLKELIYLNFRKNKVTSVGNIDFKNAGYQFVDGRFNPIQCSTFNGKRSDSINIICKE